MARSFSTSKALSTLISDAISRRGFAAAAAPQGRVTGDGRVGVSVAAALKKKVGEDRASQKVSWVPDPKTGYYRPETGAEEIDAAELRAALLNYK